MFAALHGYEPMDAKLIVGMTLVDLQWMPMALGGVRFQDGIYIAYGYWGSLIKRYPSLVFRASQFITRALAKVGVTELYAEADRNIDGSDRLAIGMGGEPLLGPDGKQQEGPDGPWYIVRIANLKV